MDLGQARLLTADPRQERYLAAYPATTMAGGGTWIIGSTGLSMGFFIFYLINRGKHLCLSKDFICRDL